jgi:putative colanic acid biosynthesis UDP-glucose lipid carrier transferase
MVEHDELYEQTISTYRVRSVAKPGMTGWAQVNGLRGPTEDTELMKRRIEYDLWYIKNWSLWLDVRIIGRTVLLVVFGDKNAH